jgi:hypothetical protein
MPAMKIAVSSALVACMVSTLAACVYEDEPPRRLAPEPSPAEDPGSGGTSSGSSGGTGALPPPSTGSPAPMLVEIDTDQTMTAQPGEGVGVFIEYAKGGHWHLWWTCDTLKTRQSCDFAVSASAATGNLTKLDASELTGGFHTEPTPSRVEAKTTTSREVHGIKFDTSPGAVLTVEASIGGLKDGAFLFFVQDGQVNGGYTGKLTNPLQLEGKTP